MILLLGFVRILILSGVAGAMDLLPMDHRLSLLLLRTLLPLLVVVKLALLELSNFEFSSSLYVGVLDSLRVGSREGHAKTTECRRREAEKATKGGTE